MADLFRIKFNNNSQKRLVESLPLACDNRLYVLDWYNEDDAYYAVGIDRRMRMTKLKMKDVVSGLYLWTLDVELAQALLVNLIDTGSLHVVWDRKYYVNTVTVLDSIANPPCYEKQWILCKIKTSTFDASRKLYYTIVKDPVLSRHIAPVGQWNLHTFLTVEKHVREEDFIFGVIMDDNFRDVDGDAAYELRLPTVVLDIETVSDDDYRLPMGSHLTDHIMSVTVVVDEELHVLFNLPLDSSSAPDELEKSKKLLETVDSSQYYRVKQRHVHVVTTERELLSKMLKILESIPGPYICLGYNSRGYDLPFLFNRCTYLNMPEAHRFNFINDILSYGKNMLHFDLNQALVKYFSFELSSFSLKNVALKLLSDQNVQKLDFDARNLRYIYKFISDRNHINDGNFTNEICSTNSHVPWRVDLATLAKYNEMDCLVVLALWDSLQYWNFVNYVSKNFFMPLVRVFLSKLSEYLSGNMVYMGLKYFTLFGPHHECSVVTNDNMIMKLSMDNIISRDDSGSSYGGGFNYRLSKTHYDTVHAMDAQAYYPSLISGMNISHETCSVISVKDFITVCDYSPDFDESNYRFVSFHDHKTGILTPKQRKCKSLEKMENNIVPFGHVHCNLDQCKFLTLSEVREAPPHCKIIVIHRTHRGILPRIIERRNMLRNVSKVSKKQIEGFVGFLKKLKAEYSDKSEEEKEEEEPNHHVKADAVVNWYVVKDPDEPEDLHMAKCQVRIIERQVFDNAENSLQLVTDCLRVAEAESVRLNSLYKNMKLLNNSVYGLLGSSYGLLKSKNNAAAITMLGRMFIIESAKIGNAINGRTVFSDTDSVFFDLSRAIVPRPDDYIANTVADKYPCVKLNVEVYTSVLILGRKTYIGTQNGEMFSRGINKNGPALWKHMMERLYTRFVVKREPLTPDQVFNVLKNMYDETFEVIRRDKTACLKTMNVRSRESYTSNLPVTRLMDRIAKKHPLYVFGNKVSCFYLNTGNVSDIHYALDIELSTTPLNKINIFKFYSSMNMAFYNILSTAIELNAFEQHAIVMKYSSVEFKKSNKLAYLSSVTALEDGDL